MKKDNRLSEDLVVIKRSGGIVRILVREDIREDDQVCGFPLKGAAKCENGKINPNQPSYTETCADYVRDCLTFRMRGFRCDPPSDPNRAGQFGKIILIPIVI